MSIDEIKAKYGAPADLSVERLRAWLRTKLKSFHPDSNGGEFKAEADRAAFNEIQDALEFLEGVLNAAKEPRSLITVEGAIQAALVPFVEKKNELAEYRARQEVIEKKQAQVTTLITKSFGDLYAFRKIGSGVFAVIFAALLAFPNSILENAFFKEVLSLISRDAYRVGMLYAFTFVALGLLFSGLFFVWTWLREKRESAKAALLLTDEKLGALFRWVGYSEHVKLSGEVTTEDFVQSLRLEGLEDDAVYLHQMADLIAEKLLLRGAIQEVRKGSASRRFKISEQSKIDLGITKQPDAVPL